MLSVSQAETVILDAVQPFDGEQDQEEVTLLAASGRILAAPVSSTLNFPHWDNSAMDGYAVRHQDIAGCNPEHPAILTVVEEIPAGRQPQCTLQAGQAARILTGAMMPEGADTVVMQEITQRSGNQVTILECPQPQAFVRHQGEFYQAGKVLLEPGIELKAPDIAVLAAAQAAQVRVYPRPRVAIFSTGDELVTPEQPLQPGQIVDSNQYALAALVAQCGAIPQLMGIIPDRPEALQMAIASALTQADMIISSGGVSVGDYDYVDSVLTQLGATLHCRSVGMKPGKPLTFATFNSKTLYFGLPGNPVSALVNFWRFVQPALRKLSGLKSGWKPTFLQARVGQDLRSNGRLEFYLWGQLHLHEEQLEFRLSYGGSSSGNLINLAGCTALAVIPVGQSLIAAGEVVKVLAIAPERLANLG